MPSALAPAEAATTPSAARSVCASPLYRGATVALFLSGLGTSAAAPQITLFLVNDLHVSLTTAGLFYLTNITAVATASAVFMSSTAIASALGGLTGSLGVSVLGLPHVFFAPALYGLIASGGIAVMSRCRFAVH
jgi:SET family sugar efflux transporter-like MFS transporter